MHKSTHKHWIVDIRVLGSAPWTHILFVSSQQCSSDTKLQGSVFFYWPSLLFCLQIKKAEEIFTLWTRRSQDRRSSVFPFWSVGTGRKQGGVRWEGRNAPCVSERRWTGAELSSCCRPRRFARAAGCSNSSDKPGPETRSSAVWSPTGSDCTCRTRRPGRVRSGQLYL